LRLNSKFDRDLSEFRLKAFAMSKGTAIHMWEVIPEKFEHGEDVIDTKTGRQGQVRCTSWDKKQEQWRYCIDFKDIDDPEKYIPEPRLTRAPAQTRLDTGKKILYAPRKLKHQRRLPPYFRPVKHDRWYSDWQTRPLTKPMKNHQ
jgi:hypothetical protein